MIKVGITGGIGSGKSVVSKLLEILGFPVYYSDSMAKQLINNSPVIINSLKRLYGDDIYINDTINKKKLASIIFNSKTELNKVNSIVHPLVAIDFNNWVTMQDSEIVFNESAIVFESSIENRFDYIIGVVAPLDIRIDRAFNRDRTSRKEIIERINNQVPQDYIIENCDYIIENHSSHILLSQILDILDSINKESRSK